MLALTAIKNKKLKKNSKSKNIHFFTCVETTISEYTQLHSLLLPKFDPYFGIETLFFIFENCILRM